MGSLKDSNAEIKPTEDTQNPNFTHPITQPFDSQIFTSNPTLTSLICSFSRPSSTILTV